MKIILIPVVLSVPFTLFMLPLIIRAYARYLADQMIYGLRPRTEKLINRSIFLLTRSNNRLTKDEEPDNRRILQLRDRLKKIQNPHG